MTLPVFLVAPGAFDGARPGQEVTITGPEARHAAVVRRVRVGERVDVVDGAGVRVRGAVTSVASEQVRVMVDDVEREPAHDVALVLVQALAKGDRDELAIEAATELGVDAVRPWQAERSVSLWVGAKAERGAHRWEAVVTAAAKQARRARVPAVRPLVRGRDLVGVAARAVGDGHLVLVLHEEAATPLADVSLPPRGEVHVVVGPEGGLTDGEVSALQGAGAVVVRLGPHVLRTSTAGPVAVALIAERLGRWAVAR